MKLGVVIVLGLAGVIVYLTSATPGEGSQSVPTGDRDRASAAAHAHGPANAAVAHPLTPERERIQRENQLVGALNDAVDLNDVDAMRRLIELYREHDPSDAHKLQEGYTRIADCLQAPGSEATARAQAYYDTERASTLRRYVRRACLE